MSTGVCVCVVCGGVRWRIRWGWGGSRQVGCRRQPLPVTILLSPPSPSPFCTSARTNTAPAACGGAAGVVGGVWGVWGCVRMCAGGNSGYGVGGMFHHTAQCTLLFTFFQTQHHGIAVESRGMERTGSNGRYAEARSSVQRKLWCGAGKQRVCQMQPNPLCTRACAEMSIRP